MAGQSTDFFTEVGNPGTATTLAAPGHSIGGSSFTVVSTSNWPTTTGAVFAIDTYTLQTVNGVQTAVRTPGSYTEWEGVVASSTSITGAVLRYGTDQNYPAGSTTRVYIPVASSRENRLVQGLTTAIFNQDGTMKNNAITSAAQITDGIIGDAEMAASVKPVTLFNENTFDHIVSGCVWTADAAGSTRNASMTSGVVMLAGKRLTVAAVTARSFTASKDVYVDFSDNGDGTALITYTDNTTNAASPALTGLRNGIVVVGATNIAAAGSINQGQETAVLPIASSIPYSVTDSLGNLICPRDPNRRILGYRQVITGITTASASYVQITGLTCPVIVPTGRKIKATAKMPTFTTSGGNVVGLSVWDGVVASGTQISESGAGNTTPTTATHLDTAGVTTPATASKTYNAGFKINGGSTLSTNSGAAFPTFILIELQ